MRIAVYGGTFDPPHIGHLAVARAAADHFSLDRILLAPTGLQPLKSEAPHASFADRCAMTSLLCDEDPRLALTRADALRPDGQPNYTIDLLTTLRAELQQADELYVLLGVDAFQHFARWRSPHELLHLAQWIIVSRPGLDVDATITTVLTQLNATARRNSIHALHNVAEPASATEVRDRLAGHLPCDDLLPAGIHAYIRQHNLYIAP